MLLEKINEPKDLKKLSLGDLSKLAAEIRQRIIEVTSSYGGHIASSLGAVELAISLHYCLDTPRDKIIWDVGHQAYAHKILTGRNSSFNTLRQFGGLSGFPNCEESPYDVFTAGHSSSSISLALGLASSRDYLSAREYFKVISVIGDGSLSGGLCFEGLNNVGHFKKDMLVILNTNELSIAPNAGAISTYINKVISLPVYNRFRDSLESFVKTRLPKGSRLIKLVNKFEEGLKGLFIPGVFFEELGFRYFGPLDGHEFAILIPTLKNVLSIKGPRLLHIVTKKGKGYIPAERDPVRFHSTGPFEIITGSKITDKETPRTYTRIFGDKLVDLAKVNKKIVAISAAMPEGTGLDKFRDIYPERFFDVGIAEAHAVCFAGGLAKAGLKPVVAIYSTFLQRAYDQIIEDVALQKIGVVFAVDRAGIVGEDGPTHQGIFDVSFLRNIPGMILMAPKDGLELENMLELALKLDRPVAIRYPKDKIPNSEFPMPNSQIRLGIPEVVKEGREAVVFALGSMVYPALEAAHILEKEGIDIKLVNSRFVKPLDKEIFGRLVSGAKFVFSIEEAVLDGGFGSAVIETIDHPVIRLGIPSEFIMHGRRDILLEKYGLTKNAIAKRIKLFISSHNYNRDLQRYHGRDKNR